MKRKNIQYKIWDRHAKKWWQPTFDGCTGKIEDLSLSPKGELLMRTRKDTLSQEVTIHESMFKGRFEIVWITTKPDRHGRIISQGDIITHSAMCCDGVIRKSSPVKWCEKWGTFVFGDKENILANWDSEDLEIVGSVYRPAIPLMQYIDLGFSAAELSLLDYEHIITNDIARAFGISISELKPYTTNVRSKLNTLSTRSIFSILESVEQLLRISEHLYESEAQGLKYTHKDFSITAEGKDELTALRDASIETIKERWKKAYR